MLHGLATLSQMLGQGHERQEGLVTGGRWIGGTLGAGNGLSGPISLPYSIRLKEPRGTETALSSVLSPRASEPWEPRSWIGTLKGHMGACVSLCDM